MAALADATVNVQCPDCGVPIECTLKTELAGHANLRVTAPDVADRVIEHKAAGQCGSDSRTFGVRADG